MRCHRPRAGARGARRTAWRSLPVRRAFRSDPPPSLLRSHPYGQRSPAARPSISTLAITARDPPAGPARQVAPGREDDEDVSGERQQGVFLAVPVFLLDSFPARTFSGNVAGVVLLESAAPNWWMQGVAAELVLRSSKQVDEAAPARSWRWRRPSPDPWLGMGVQLGGGHRGDLSDLT
jgi:hypothetical protein